MQPLILQPEQILVPGEYLPGDFATLEHYFGIFEKGSTEDLAPVAVAHHSLGDRQEEYFSVSENNMLSIGAYRRKVQEYIDRGAEYFLLDGNHRTIASVLTHQPISAMQLQTGRDISEFISLAEKKDELFRWPHGSNSLRKIVQDFERFCVEYLDKMMTIRERVDKLAHSIYLPQYIKERYQQK